MGYDITAFFDVNVAGAESIWLHEQLKHHPAELTALIEKYGYRWQLKDWEFRPSLDHSGQDLWGPGGFVFRFTANLLQVSTVVRYSEFAYQPETRALVRRFGRLLAEILRSDSAVYTHELLTGEGDCLAQMAATLRQEIGAPAANFQEMAQADYYGPHCWYIDDFTDLDS